MSKARYWQLLLNITQTRYVLHAQIFFSLNEFNPVSDSENFACVP